MYPDSKNKKNYYDQSGLNFDPQCHTFTSFFLSCPLETLNHNKVMVVVVDLILNVMVNNLSVMLEWSHRFLGITSTFLGVNASSSRTQNGDPSEDGTSNLSIWSQTP